MISPDDLSRIRAQLPAVTDTVYLNAGTLGPMPQCTADVLATELDLDVQRRQYPELWSRLGELQVAARTALARLTGVNADQIALMHSTHEGINTCLWGLDLAPGDSIVTTDEEHMGVLVPLRHIAERRGVQLRFAPWAASDDAWVEAVLREVDATTRAVLVSHVSWVTGRIAPLRALRAALPAGCRIIVDGAQSAGVLTVDPADGWDAYTVSGQKWPCGPNGSGGLALRDPEAWQPTYGAGLQVADYTKSLTSPLVADGRRFETSQEQMPPIAGLASSITWLLDEVGIDRARAHAEALNLRARAALAQTFPTTALHGDVHLLCLDVAPGSAEATSIALAEDHISIRNLGADRVRMSFGAWNSVDDVDRCVAALIARA